MAKKIVILSDGTGNEIEQNLSNVLKLYQCIQRNDDQVAFYDPGIGTIADAGGWSRVRAKTKAVWGLATGQGLDRNVLDAYRYLIRTWEPGDDVYMFGFSRGAYTVRVLAGFVHLVGLLHPDQENLAEHALVAYKKGGHDSLNFDRKQAQANQKTAERVREVMETRHMPIRFLGCWDSVASVIVPRADRLFIPSLQTLPYTKTNPSVQTFRHALAIDEKRRMFRVEEWLEGRPYLATRTADDSTAPDQDVQQVWFAGSHSDVGGGYPEQDSGVAKYPLRWMIDAARETGLQFDETLVEEIVDGQGQDFSAPSPEAKLNDSMNAVWSIFEYLPRKLARREWPDRKGWMGYYLPKSEPRLIPDGALIHDSVWDRHAVDPGYRPPNLPEPPASPS